MRNQGLSLASASAISSGRGTWLSRPAQLMLDVALPLPSPRERLPSHALGQTSKTRDDKGAKDIRHDAVQVEIGPPPAGKLIINELVMSLVELDHRQDLIEAGPTTPANTLLPRGRPSAPQHER